MKNKEKIDVSKTILKIDGEIAFLKGMKKRIKEIGNGNYFTLKELKEFWKNSGG